ncbi:hypothetical protein RRG08_004014 [Elysia crispata]|uniref:Uncharacterized protein n=1 Tax=Elysia crispata TaxID=231223 RepID=A0AAE1CT39_9GAST|nr:hypothetical protein RRG08_004014 [Elysia crispata]
MSGTLSSLSAAGGSADDNIAYALASSFYHKAWFKSYRAKARADSQVVALVLSGVCGSIIAASSGVREGSILTENWAGYTSHQMTDG